MHIRLWSICDAGQDVELSPTTFFSTIRGQQIRIASFFARTVIHIFRSTSVFRFLSSYIRSIRHTRIPKSEAAADYMQLMVAKYWPFGQPICDPHDTPFHSIPSAAIVNDSFP